MYLTGKIKSNMELSMKTKKLRSPIVTICQNLIGKGLVSLCQGGRLKVQAMLKDSLGKIPVDP